MILLLLLLNWVRCVYVAWVDAFRIYGPKWRLKFVQRIKQKKRRKKNAQTKEQIKRNQKKKKSRSLCCSSSMSGFLFVETSWAKRNMTHEPISSIYKSWTVNWGTNPFLLSVRSFQILALPTTRRPVSYSTTMTHSTLHIHSEKHCDRVAHRVFTNCDHRYCSLRSHICTITKFLRGKI